VIYLAFLILSVAFAICVIWMINAVCAIPRIIRCNRPRNTARGWRMNYVGIAKWAIFIGLLVIFVSMQIECGPKDSGMTGLDVIVRFLFPSDPPEPRYEWIMEDTA
jgi:hypothetical protein